MITQTPPPSPTQEPFAQRRELQTGLRSDLQITRQVTRGQPVYVVYDPVSFRAHRLSLRDYQVIACLNEYTTLLKCFQHCIAEGLLTSDDEADFHAYVLRLESLGLMTTSTRKEGELYKSFKAKEAARDKLSLASLLFLSVPLANPDKFLDRTVHRFAFLYDSKFVFAWLAGLVTAIMLIVSRWSEFTQPLNNLLAVKNLALMWLAFAGLKVWHELGHGYACKLFGGRVPEMGCKLIFGMPLAYVDVTSAWSFPTKRQRIIVMLGGMYFESLVAIVAAFVWAFTPHSLLGSFAFQLIFMAGVATIVFNINPLMRYDGYFILSDCLGLPNLRSVSVQEVQANAKQLVLGIPNKLGYDTKSRWILNVYGITSTLYIGLLSLSIAVLIATYLKAIGLVVAAIQLYRSLAKPTKKLFQYLWSSPETEPMRLRSRIVAGVIAIACPMLLLLFPNPSGLQVTGLVTAARTTTVYAESAGCIQEIGATVGTTVRANEPLMRLQNRDTEVAQITEGLVAATARKAAYTAQREDLTLAAKLHHEAAGFQKSFEEANRNAMKLTIKAPHDGRLVKLLPNYAVGTFVNVGDPVATIVAGDTQVRTWLDEEQIRAGHIAVGSTVRLRFADVAGTTCFGEVLALAPATPEEFEDLALTPAGNESILVDPLSGKTQKPLFKLLVQIPRLPSTVASHQARVYMKIGSHYEPLGIWMLRSILAFSNRISASS